MIGYVAYDLSTATARPKKAEKTAEEEVRGHAPRRSGMRTLRWPSVGRDVAHFLPRSCANAHRALLTYRAPREWERKEITRIEEERVRQALAGEAKLGAADEDVFEGMEPAHIELWMAHERTKRGKASLHDVDPYEGLSPEEIQALVDGK